MNQQPHKRSRFHYSGSYLQQAVVIQSGNLEATLARLLDKVSLAGEHNLVITKIIPAPLHADGLAVLGNTRFGVDLMYVDKNTAYIFYLEVPFGMVPERIVTRLKAAGLSQGTRPEEKKYEPLGRIPNRTYVPRPRVTKTPPKIKLAREKKPPKQKKSDHVLWNILTKYRVNKDQKALLLSDAPPDHLLESLADRALAASDWTTLAEVNELLETSK